MRLQGMERNHHVSIEKSEAKKGCHSLAVAHAILTSSLMRFYNLLHCVASEPETFTVNINTHPQYSVSNVASANPPPPLSAQCFSDRHDTRWQANACLMRCSLTNQSVWRSAFHRCHVSCTATSPKGGQPCRLCALITCNLIRRVRIMLLCALESA
jgi:hypothetical protein